MAYVTPIDQPLSESQAKLIAQVGSMKNLADLSFLTKFKIKKEDSMSMFDYLMKVLRAMGIDPQIILTAFINDFFRTEKLVELILTSVAQLSTAMNIDLSNSSNNSTGNNQTTVSSNQSTSTLTADEIRKKMSDANYNWLNSTSTPINIRESLFKIVNVLKTKIIQELMILLFGMPKKTESAVGSNGLVSNQNRLNELLDEAVCGGGEIFSMSNPIYTSNGELSYNRLQRVERVKNGNLNFSITCQGVDISLPDDPMYLFRDAPPGFYSSETVSPQEAIGNIFNHVNNQVQKQTSGSSSQSNAQSSGKSFTQKFLETLISSITCLLSPFFIGFVGTIPDEASTLGQTELQMLKDGILNVVFPNSVITDPYTNKRVGDFVPATSCEITKEYDKNNLTIQQKKKVTLMTILCNLALSMVIGFILAYVIEKVKKLILKYVVKRAQEKIKRRIESIKLTFQNKYGGKNAKKISNTKKQVKLLAKVQPALSGVKNTINNVPSFSTT